MKNSKRGSSILTAPIIIVIGTMIVTSFIVLAVQIVTPFLWYEKLSSTCIKYLFIMEEYGYLTSKEARNLKEELQAQGFEVERLKMKYTNDQVAYRRANLFKNWL